MKKHLEQSIRAATLVIACSTALSACAPYAISENDPLYRGQAPYSPTAQFDRLDLNRDGFLSRGEVETLGLVPDSAAPTPQSAADTFRRLDTNADGFLSRAEIGTTFNAIPGGSFDAFDTNRDGFINMTEALPHLQYLQNRQTPVLSFSALDTDRDGFLSRTEAGPLLASPRGTGGYVGGSTLSFDRLDINRDGFLSRAEASSIANPLAFDRYDLNRDNFLSRSEADALLRDGVSGTAGR